MIRFLSLFKSSRSRTNWLNKLKKQNHFRLKSAQTWYGELVLFLVFGLTLSILYFANQQGSTRPMFASTFNIKLVPTSDVASQGVEAAGGERAQDLYKNVDDGTSFFNSDNDNTMVVQSQGTVFSAHTVGYMTPDNLTGQVTGVTVNYRAFAKDTEGYSWVELYDQDVLIGKSPARSLNESWQNLTEEFFRLTISNPRNIRTKVVLTKKNTKGQVGYTQIWIKLRMSK